MSSVFLFSYLCLGIAQNFVRKGRMIIRLHNASSLLVKLGNSFIEITNLLDNLNLIIVLDHKLRVEIESDPQIFFTSSVLNLPSDGSLTNASFVVFMPVSMGLALLAEEPSKPKKDCGNVIA